MAQEYKKTGNGGNVVGAMMFAAALGAVVGMLFAPKRGTETREDLKNKYNDAKNRSQDMAMDARDRFNRGVDAARSKVGQAADKTKDVADKAADKAKDKADEAAGKVTQKDQASLSEHIEAESTRRRRSM
jgi:gas vesicle protein